MPSAHRQSRGMRPPPTAGIESGNRPALSEIHARCFGGLRGVSNGRCHECHDDSGVYDGVYVWCYEEYQGLVRCVILFISTVLCFDLLWLAFVVFVLLLAANDENENDRHLDCRRAWCIVTQST